MRVSHHGFSAGINSPQALQGEGLFGLPPYAPLAAYRVSDFPNAPGAWSRGDEVSATYFVGVEEGRGMWIDLTGNQKNSSHVAAIVSVQGVNAITARKVDDMPVLEQYRTACPIHGDLFISNRRCSVCGFDWPAQNYLSSATGKTMWIDGFRTKGSNGDPSVETRQFFFTSDTSRGIAAQTIGEERTFSVKIHFYRGPQQYQSAAGRGPSLLSASSAQVKGRMYAMSASASSSQSFEVGAGARIRQDVGVDPLSVSQYGERLATIEFYYVGAEEALRILGSNPRNDGALSGLNVGNPGNKVGHKTY